MKRVLSLVLALVMVLGMIPTFAAEMTGGEHLLEHGFITGKPGDDVATKLDAGAALTRQELAALIAELMGEKEIAAVFAQPADYADADKIGAWAVPFVAYAQVNGWMSGKPGNMFDPTGPVPGQQLAAVLMNALGYTVDTQAKYATVIADAAVLGLAVPSGNLTRGEAFTAMWTAVSEVKVNGEEVTLGVKLGKLTPPAPVVVDLAVSSVTAINTKQVEVVFNQAVDKVLAETETNYTIVGSAFSKAALQADGKTVVLTLEDEDAMTNAGTATVKVLKAIKSATGVALAADHSATINVVDVTVPSIVGIEAVGSRTLKITFTEPVFDGTDATIANNHITVKSGIYTYVVQSAVADYANRTVTVTVGTDLIEGALTVKVNAAGMVTGAIRDFAGLIAIPMEIPFNFVKDTTIASAELVSVNKATKVAKVVFSKPVYGADVVLYHSVNGVAAYGTAPVTVIQADASTEWEFTFTNALPSGNLNFFLVNSNTAANQITDLWGVKVPNLTFTYNVVADTTPPTVADVKVNTNVSFEIKFSEAIDQAEIKVANFEVLKPDGTALTVTPSLKGGTTDTVLLTGTLVDNTTYTVTVKAMKDVAGNAMPAAYTVQKTVGDNENPEVTKAYLTDAKTLYVVFSEDMNQADITNKTNYKVNGNILGTDDTVTLISPSKVKIVKVADITIGATALEVGPVRDLAGKRLDADSVFSSEWAIVNDTLTFTAELIAVNKAKIKFSNEIGAFDANEFTIVGAQWLAVESNTLVSGKSEVVLVLDTNLAPNATPAVASVVTPVNTKSIEGTLVVANTSVNAADKVAPTVDRVVFIDANTILVYFKEALSSSFFAAAGNNGFSVVGGTLTSASLQGTNGNVVVLAGSNFTVDTDVSYNGTNGLKDMATVGNALAAFTHTAQLVADTAVPTATFVSATTTTIVIQWSEAVTGAGTVGNFALTTGTAVLQSASYNPTTLRTTLTFDTNAVANGNVVTITTANIEDLSGNATTTATVTVSGM